MIAYMTIGTNDLARAATFYDALLTPFGAKRAMETDRYVAWGTGSGTPMLLLIKPYDGAPATVGNGTMVALHAASREKVDAAYRHALALGARDEGAAGPRDGKFYGGYVRDLDGNKLAICHFG